MDCLCFTESKVFIELPYSSKHNLFNAYDNFSEEEAAERSIKVIAWVPMDEVLPEVSPRLTKKQRLFCELVETGWLARDYGGSLYWYRSKPAKVASAWNGRAAFRHITITNIVDFPFIQWEDKEPYSIEEMLTWEVVEC